MHVTSQCRCAQGRRILILSSMSTGGYLRTPTLYRKFETNIPSYETARTGTLFLHLCIWERFIYSRNPASNTHFNGEEDFNTMPYFGMALHWKVIPLTFTKKRTGDISACSCWV
jgi:hypothetical protein